MVEKYRLDAIVAPTAGPAKRHSTIPVESDWPVCTKPAVVAGYPHITVPAGLVRVEGLARRNFVFRASLEVGASWTAKRATTC